MLALVGTVAALTLSGRKATGAGAPWWALLVALVGAVVGFFMIPLVGIVVGGIGGLWLAELMRLRAPKDGLGHHLGGPAGLRGGHGGPDGGGGRDRSGSGWSGSGLS